MKGMSEKVYLDHAASTPLDPEVFEQMRPYLLNHYGNPSSTHAFGRELRNAIEESRRTIAGLVGAQPGEICFTSGGTEADNLGILGLVRAHELEHIISTRIEHHAVTHPIETLAKGGKEVTWLPVNEKGHIDLTDLQAALDRNPKALVSLMHANNELGSMHDVEAIGSLCTEYGAYFHSDTVQSIGCYRYNLAELPLHCISASAHKFNGPKGIGFLFVRKGTGLQSILEGGSQERNLRAGTENVPGIVGLAHALKKTYGQLEEKKAHLTQMKRYMKEQLQLLFPDLGINGETDENRSLPTVLNVSFPCGGEDAMLLFQLDLAGIAVSGGSACNSGALIGSHVLREIKASKNALLNSIRFSFGMATTKAELDFVLAQLKSLVKAPTM
jgi:cysteine desulfurase